MNHDELISNADTIVLARVLSVVDYDKVAITDPDHIGASGTRYEFEVTETLKGSREKKLSFQTVEKNYSDRDFNNHKDKGFWVNGSWRSDHNESVCELGHTFIKGRTYLLFPSHFGAAMSAEVIKSNSDMWLTYVKKRL